MKYFKDMFRCFKEKGVTSLKNGDQLLPSNAEFSLKCFEKCQPFVFQPLEDKEIKEMEGEKHAHIDAPFSVFSVEMAGDKAVCFDPGSFENGVFSKHRINCIMTIESEKDGRVIWLHYFHVKYSNGQEHVFACSGHFNTTIQDLITRIHKEAVGADKQPRVMSYPHPTNPKKKKRIIKDKVFIVAPKSYKNTIEGKKIDWSHRWNVRGHWVHFWIDKENGIIDLTRIGKNREGEYCVPGRTWRVESVKGPEDKPLIKKTRMVFDET